MYYNTYSSLICNYNKHIFYLNNNKQKERLMNPNQEINICTQAELDDMNDTNLLNYEIPTINVFNISDITKFMFDPGTDGAADFTGS